MMSRLYERSIVFVWDGLNSRADAMVSFRTRCAPGRTATLLEDLPQVALIAVFLDEREKILRHLVIRSFGPCESASTSTNAFA